MPRKAADQTRHLSEISRAEAVVSIRALVMEALALENIHSAYFLAPLTADPRIGRLLSAIGTNRIWERHYRARLHLIDPLPDFSLTQSSAFYWPDALKGSKLTKKQQRYMQISAQFGLGRGIGTACYGPHGRSGFLGVAWTQEGTPAAHVLQWVNIVGQTSFGRYCQVVRNDADVPALSNRELEVLSWICEGKSNNVIAQILGISRSSVDIYVRRIFAKLGVADRTAACLRGFSLGLTVTGDYKRLVEEARARTPGDAI